MKQLLQNLRNGETSVEDVPIPNPKPRTALIRTANSLVSAGTERMIVSFAEKSLVGKARSRPDLVRQVFDKARREGILTSIEAALNRLDQPMPLGYSSSGTIVSLGKEMEGFKVGQRVSCAGGGYAVHAEYAVVPKNLLALLPDNVTFEEGAFATLGSIALHGFRLSSPQIGESVAVIGLGLLGLLVVEIGLAAGCKVFGVDLDLERVALASQAGAKAVIRSNAEEAALAISQGRGMDVVLICADSTSDDPVQLAGEISREKARVVAVGSVGQNLPRKTYYMKELSFVNSRSYGPGRYDVEYEEGGHDYPLGYVRWTEGRNLQAFIDLVSEEKVRVNRLITHRFSISNAPDAYQLISGKQSEKFLGVILTYPEIPDSAVEIQTESEYHLKNLPPRVDQSLDKVHLGVIGAGNFATAVLLPTIKKISEIERISIASASGLTAQHAARKFGFQQVARSSEEIFQDQQLNCLAILTRHHLHAEQVMESLEKGLHTFVEKPLALNRDDLTSIRNLLNNKDMPLLMVGFNRRFAPLAQKLWQFFQGTNEPIYAHYRVNAGFLPLTHWLHDPQQGGGRIIGESCHFIDFLVFLSGESPKTVTTVGLPESGNYREDNIQMTFEFSNGSIGTVTYLANGDKSFPKERVEVFSGGRIAVLDDFRVLETVKNGNRKVFKSRLRQDKGHRGEWDAFVQAILQTGEPPIPYAHIFGVSDAAIAAVEALRTQQKINICG